MPRCARLPDSRLGWESGSGSVGHMACVYDGERGRVGRYSSRVARNTGPAAALLLMSGFGHAWARALATLRLPIGRTGAAARSSRGAVGINLPIAALPLHDVVVADY